MSNSVIIALGSNINADFNIRKAFSILEQHFRVISKAGPIVTSPVGIFDQPDFLNAVVLVETTKEQPEIILLLKEIENQMGRDRSRPKFGPREIDLDLLIWNNQVMDKDYYDREFLRKLVKEL